MIQEKNEGFSIVKLKKEKYLITFSKISGNNWVLGIAYPVKQLFSPIAEIRDEINRSSPLLSLKFILIAVFFLLLSAFLVSKFFNKYVLISFSFSK